MTKDNRTGEIAIGAEGSGIPDLSTGELASFRDPAQAVAAIITAVRIISGKRTVFISFLNGVSFPERQSLLVAAPPPAFRCSGRMR